MINFKNARAEMEYNIMPKKLREVAETFETFSLYYGITPFVTRVRESVDGDSGVHEVGRGIDYRDQYASPGAVAPMRLYSPEQVADIVRLINERFPRTDGKPTCLHHSFKGFPYHFHLQIRASDLLAGEPIEPVSDQT